MKKLKLNSGMKSKKTIDGYRLNPTEKYVINLEDEMEFAMLTMQTVHMFGFPPAFKNWYAWLCEPKRIPSYSEREKFMENFNG